MSNLDPEKNYSNLTDVLQFAFNQFLKNLYISIPGVIESYDPEKKRCRVKPALNIRLTDGETVEQSTIINVPVVWPSGGGFTFISPLPEGEPVVIMFSQRGITQFKETFSTVDPGNGIFDKEDAYVMPGYGALSITPATTSGASMQTEDGQNYIYVTDGIVKIKAGTKLEIDTPEIAVTGIITGSAVFGGANSDNHIHSQGNDTGGDSEQDTGGPHS